jgi:hypothetical protein
MFSPIALNSAVSGLTSALLESFLTRFFVHEYLAVTWWSSTCMYTKGFDRGVSIIDHEFTFERKYGPAGRSLALLKHCSTSV